VLDNCEHLLDACAILAGALLRNCPDLRLLATSRQALGVTGEVRMPVPPMPVPAGDQVPIEQVMSSEAVWLLSDRTAAVVPGFKVDAANAGPVLQLRQRLEGIPLALELAAVRLGASLDQLNRGLASDWSIQNYADAGEDYYDQRDQRNREHLIRHHQQALARLGCQVTLVPPGDGSPPPGTASPGPGQAA
jgi:predicted ATPase